MHAARRSFVATALAALLAALGITAAIAAGPAADGPPKIAFLANGHEPADALAAGPVAGQLGAPLYTTTQGDLADAARAALESYDPELVIVLGGPVAISDAVIHQVEAATGLAETSAAHPSGGVVRAAGGDRFSTATAVADLLAGYDPAFVSVGAAVDADTLDGRDASAFLPADGKATDAAHADTADTATSASDADTLDGQDSTAFAGADDLTHSWVRQPDNFGFIDAATEVDILTTTFTAPADGIVNIGGSVWLNQRGTDQLNVYVSVLANGMYEVTGKMQLAPDGSFGQSDRMYVPATMEVTAGQQYTLDLRVRPYGNDVDLYFETHRLEATFIPSGQAAFDDSAY